MCFSLQDVYRGLPGGQQALPGLRQPRAQDQAAPQTQVPDRVTQLGVNALRYDT